MPGQLPRLPLDGGAGQAPAATEPLDPPPAFVSLLSATAIVDCRDDEPPDRVFVSDLRLDQIVDGIVSGRDDRDYLAALCYRQVSDTDVLRYRHEIFRDLENPGLSDAVRRFSAQLRLVRSHLTQLGDMRSARQRQGWLLDAAAIYCDAVKELAADLTRLPAAARGMLAFRAHLTRYADSANFAGLSADTAARKSDLAQIRYLVRVRADKVEVSRYAGEDDYSAEIEKAFERFRQGAVKDYRITYRGWPGMNHVGAKVLDLVARLFPGEFSRLDDYCERHADFFDPAIRQFDRQVQFYLAYADYTAPLRTAGLPFCYPDLTAGSKEIFATDTFDLALAAKLTGAGAAVVTNEFYLSEPERIFVVSGPNQGGKTTFARTFGQLHHLASVGCPVPGSAARLFMFDQIFTHFEREEDLDDLTGKLEDDLIRIQKVLRSATPASIVVMNEIFTSTSLKDAAFLGRKVVEKVIELDLLCVYVTFIDELASLGDTVVSMASTIVPGNPAERTYKLVRKPADGLAYALAIANKHGVTYERLKGRLSW